MSVNTKKQKISITIGKQKLILGDCLNELKKIDADTVDIVVTSPPYNIGLNYNSYYDAKGDDEYLDWLYEILKNVKRVLKREGSVFLNIGSTNKNPWTSMHVAERLKKLFYLQNNIIWVKSINIDNETFGHFKPVNSKRFLNNNYENIFHFTKENEVNIDRYAVGVPYKYKSNIKRFGREKDVRCSGNVWFIPYKTVQSKSDRFNHPGTFPKELVARCIKLHGGKTPLVLDPFMGTGTTLVVAAELNCAGIGMEVDKYYFDIAAERLKNEK